VKEDKEHDNTRLLFSLSEQGVALMVILLVSPLMLLMAIFVTVMYGRPVFRRSRVPDLGVTVLRFHVPVPDDQRSCLSRMLHRYRTIDLPVLFFVAKGAVPLRAWLSAQYAEGE
jgi:hypothetical protein